MSRVLLADDPDIESILSAVIGVHGIATTNDPNQPEIIAAFVNPMVQVHGMSDCDPERAEAMRSLYRKGIPVYVSAPIDEHALSKWYGLERGRDYTFLIEGAVPSPNQVVAIVRNVTILSNFLGINRSTQSPYQQDTSQLPLQPYNQSLLQ